MARAFWTPSAGIRTSVWSSVSSEITRRSARRANSKIALGPARKRCASQFCSRANYYASAKCSLTGVRSLGFNFNFTRIHSAAKRTPARPISRFRFGRFIHPQTGKTNLQATARPRAFITAVCALPSTGLRSTSSRGDLASLSHLTAHHLPQTTQIHVLQTGASTSTQDTIWQHLFRQNTQDNGVCDC